MGRHIIMDSSGHSIIEFDKTNASDLAEAERRFRKLRVKSFLAAEQEGDGKHRVLAPGDNRLDTDAEETIFIPALKGDDVQSIVAIGATCCARGYGSMAGMSAEAG